MYILLLVACSESLRLDQFTPINNPDDTDNSVVIDTYDSSDDVDTEEVSDTENPTDSEEEEMEDSFEEEDTEIQNVEWLDPTGLYGGILIFDYTNYYCNSCFGLSDQKNSNIFAKFYSGQQFSQINSVFPLKNTCGEVSSLPSLISMEHKLSLENQTLNKLSNNSYYRKPSYSFYDFGSSYDLYFDSEPINNVVITPEQITHFQPSQFLSPTSPYASVMQKNYAKFSYVPKEVDDFVYVTLSVLDAQKEELGTISCSFTDTGLVTIPQVLLDPYPVGSLIQFSLYKVNVNESVMPNGDTLEGVSMVGVGGTAKLGVGQNYQPIQ